VHKHAALLLGLVALVSPACSSPVTERRVARDEARAVLAAHCGSCHTYGLATARPAALAVYDLGEPEWAVRMSAAQLDNAVWRLGEPLAPDGRPNDATSAERNRLARYVALEKAARAAAPACPPDDVLEAIHAAAYHLEHDPAGGAVTLVVVAPLDDTSRSLLADLARARLDADPRPPTEQVRVRLAAWLCLTEAKHRRFHERLLHSGPSGSTGSVGAP